MRRQSTSIARRAVALCAQLPDPVMACFHYRDGAAVRAGFDDTAVVMTAFVSHSLQLAHTAIGRRTDPALLERIRTERRALETCNRAVVMSRYEAGLIDEAGYTVAALRCVSDRISIRATSATGRSGNPVRLLFSGRSDPRKNLEGFGALLADLARNGSLNGVEATGPVQGQAGFPARPLGFVPHAGFMAELKTADLVVLPSFYEPFGLVWLEALMSGAHVLAPRLSAAADMAPDPFLHIADFRSRDSAAIALLKAIEVVRTTGRSAPRGDPANAAGILAREITEAITVSH